MAGTGRYNIAQGAVATVQGIGASSSGLVVGLIVDNYGYAAAFVEAAVVATIALAVLVIIMPETTTPEPRQALHRRSGLEDRPRSKPSPVAEYRHGGA
jgi:sugar phosphate permease